mmetsp:Transcript_67700/g.189546  ORF Transcript_67700/g.189546 Transcript_67700/m.189546 type:complete len:236 (-) Transcript_67700:456-1163(-)
MPAPTVAAALARPPSSALLRDMPCSFRGGRCASSLRRPLLPADLVSWCILHPDSLQCPPWVALRRLRHSTREDQPQASPPPRCKPLGRRLASCARGLPNFSRTLLRTSSVAAAAAPTAASDHCEETLPLAWGLPQAPEVGSASPCHTPGAPARRPPPRRTDTVVATTPPQTAMRASRLQRDELQPSNARRGAALLPGDAACAEVLSERPPVTVLGRRRRPRPCRHNLLSSLRRAL